MKRARIAWAGAIHDAIESGGQLELLTPAFKGRRVAFDEGPAVAGFRIGDLERGGNLRLGRAIHSGSPKHQRHPRPHSGKPGSSVAKRGAGVNAGA